MMKLSVFLAVGLALCSTPVLASPMEGEGSSVQDLNNAAEKALDAISSAHEAYNDFKNNEAAYLVAVESCVKALGNWQKLVDTAVVDAHNNWNVAYKKLKSLLTNPDAPKEEVEAARKKYVAAYRPLIHLAESSALTSYSMWLKMLAGGTFKREETEGAREVNAILVEHRLC